MALLNLFDTKALISDTIPVLAHGIELDPIIDVDNVSQSAIDLNPIALDGPLMFEQNLLQRYIALCAQDPNGGLRDKPSKARDFYHSCYNLSGWSVAQHVLSPDGIPVVWGHPSNVLAKTHPSINIEVSKVFNIRDYFYNYSLDHDNILQMCGNNKQQDCN